MFDKKAVGKIVIASLRYDISILTKTEKIITLGAWEKRRKTRNTNHFVFELISYWLNNVTQYKPIN